MQSFFRIAIVSVLIIGAFFGGWLSSDILKQDPFLSSIFGVNSSQYDRFMQEITTVIQETRMTDQNELIELFVARQEASNFANLREQEQHIEKQTNNNESIPQGEQSEEVNELDPEVVPTNSNHEVELDEQTIVTSVDPQDMIGTIVQQMSAKEKLSFLVWARARFSDEQLLKMEEILQDGLTFDTFLSLYQYSRASLRGADYEYLLSFVDRYVTTVTPVPTPEDTIPVFQANPSTVNHPGGN